MVTTLGSTARCLGVAPEAGVEGSAEASCGSGVLSRGSEASCSSRGQRLVLKRGAEAGLCGSGVLKRGTEARCWDGALDCGDEALCSSRVQSPAG